MYNNTIFTALREEIIEMIQEGVDYLMKNRHLFKVRVEELDFIHANHRPFSSKEVVFCGELGDLKEELMTKAPLILKNEGALQEKAEMEDLFTHNMRLLESGIRTNTVTMAALSDELEKTAENEKKEELQKRITENIMDILHKNHSIKVLRYGIKSLEREIETLEVSVECAQILRNGIQEHCDRVIAASTKI